MTDNPANSPARPDLPGAAAMAAGVEAVLAGLFSGPAGPEASPTAPKTDSGPDEAAEEGGGWKRKPYKEMSAAEKRSLLHMTDEGFARRLAYYSKDRCLYCPELGWLVWDGRRYQACDEKDTYARREVMAMTPKIQQIEYPAFKKMLPSKGEAGEDMAAKAARAAGLKALGRIWSRAIALGNNALQVSVLKVAASMPQFYADFADLDDQPGLLNTPDGALDLPLTLPPAGAGDDAMMSLTPRALEEEATRPRVTRVTRAGFVTAKFRADAAEAPLWQAHLKTLFPDPKMRAYFLRICGAMLVNFNPKRSWFIWRGRGNDGKSTTLRILGDVLGDYWTIGTVETLMANPHSNSSGPRNDLMALAGGTRLVSFVEPDEKKELDAGLIKQLTGGDGVSARGNHQGQKTWMPQFKMVLLCNDLPRVKDSTDGFWQRIEIVPFSHQFTKATEDPTLEGRIKEERDGILASLIEGFFDWRARGFNFDAPDKSAKMKLRFQDESSQYLAWLRERIRWGGWYNQDSLREEDYNLPAQLHDGHPEAIAIARAHHWCEDEAVFTAPRYNPQDIYKDYLSWCDGDGLTPWKSGTFLKKFKADALDKGCIWNKTGSDGRHWKGFDFIDGFAHLPSESGGGDDVLHY